MFGDQRPLRRTDQAMSVRRMRIKLAILAEGGGFVAGGWGKAVGGLNPPVPHRSSSRAARDRNWSDLRKQSIQELVRSCHPRKMARVGNQHQFFLGCLDAIEVIDCR